MKPPYNQADPTRKANAAQPEFVVAVCGPIQSGKSKISTTAAEADGALARSSFGEYIRNILRQEGERNLEDRMVLADYGQDLVDKDVMAFTRNVIERSGWDQKQSVIIDGLRHVEVLRALRVIVFPIPVVVAYIDVSPARYLQLLAERGTSLQDVLKYNEHRTEEQVKTRLAHLADVHVDNSGSPMHAVSQLLRAARDKARRRRHLKQRILFVSPKDDIVPVRYDSVVVVDMRQPRRAVLARLEQLNESPTSRGAWVVGLIDDAPTRSQLADTRVHLYLQPPFDIRADIPRNDLRLRLAAAIDDVMPNLSSAASSTSNTGALPAPNQPATVREPK